MSDNSSLDIVILAGGISHERDVSQRSGRRVANALRAAGHRTRLIDPDANLLASLTENRPDVIWPTLHGATGEDGALLALLATTGIPIVGSKGPASALAWSKPIAKTLVARAGYSTPRSITLSRATFRDLGAGAVLKQVTAALGESLAVKPAEGGSAQGVTLLESADLLPRAMVEAYTYSDVALVEQRVRGSELGVGVLDIGEGAHALPAVEIEASSGLYSFDARYNAGETTFFTPARLADDVAELVGATAVAIHELLGLRHLSRIDFIVDEDGTPWFLEANVLPGLTETSLFPQAVEAAGLTLPATYAALAQAACA